ncbi:glycoside hydrolase family 88/105 protein [Paracoccus aestuariivivens]|uniref:Di-trans,poly-cis-decaprenylcistransferase n=1 Tax=Paracoccus aestuariivivens TaxID=1820333 RepID=A0A6L6J816_9RHOB|nr:glycoside hydrolase family 88 protein [Paracoccus aestuariivivens]MTH77335.1 di-trans,poly-cis-decaprenylcistransferase [Paracoccus aestuariivivens]
MSLTDYFDAYCRKYQAYKGGPWCYEDGCIYRGLDLLTDATRDPRWRAHLHRFVDAQIGPDGSLKGYDPEEFNIDNILSGRVLFPLWRETGDDRYLAAARLLVGQLDRHPRISTGNYWHKLRYPHQVWLDGLYMALPFQIEFGQATGETDRIKDALAQFQSALDLTETPSGLYAHGYDESREQRWSDPETGKSPAVWSRAMGWLAMALVDALVMLPNDETTAGLRLRTKRMLLKLADLQTAGGLWSQVLEAPDLQGNYEESSASAMFAYAFLRAARLGVVSSADADRLRDAGLKALHALETRCVVSESGERHFSGICSVAGLGGFSGVYRDGTPEYYLTEAVVADDAKGVGPLMMASAEAEYVASLAAE